ncbi:hypothetical protein HYS00_05415 [Candidatus Microgenomates bacterium]|nr:hypothetical protein [Candidatus Microgenomates bacterium]
MQKSVLASTLHDPQGRLLNDLPNAIKLVLHYYDAWVVSYTPVTNRRMKDVLLNHRNVFTKPLRMKDLQAKEEIEFNHLRALEIARDVAVEKHISHVQYTDADRIIMAANRFPESFELLNQKLKKYTRKYNLYINLRRTADDFFMHQLPLVQTEKVFNSLYSEAFDMPIDIGSTAHVISLDVIDEVLAMSPYMQPVSFPHPKWLIIARIMDAHIYSEEIPHLLTFETPEQYRGEIIDNIVDKNLHRTIEKKLNIAIPAHPQTGQKASTVQFNEEQKSPITRGELEHDYFLLQQTYESTIGRFTNVSSREWRLRYHTLNQYLSVLQESLHRFNYEKTYENILERKICAAIDQAKKQRDQILYLLRRKTQTVELTFSEKLQEGFG